jgi:hypothetical protein
MQANWGENKVSGSQYSQEWGGGLGGTANPTSALLL